MIAMRARKEQRSDGPGNEYISSEAVAKILGCSEEWVRKLRETGKLRAWKMNDEGTGWELIIPTGEKKQRGKAATGGRVVFSRSEVEEYKKNHVPQPHAEPVDVSPSEELLITDTASEELQSVGYVTRARLLEKLISLSDEEWKQNKPGERKLQRKIKTIADRNLWPYPPKVRKHQQED